MREVLDLRSRRQIFDLLTEFPGLHLREIQRRLGMDVRTVRHHLEFMERHGAVASLREGGYLRYYPRERDEERFRERLGPTEKRVLALLRQRHPLQVVLLLLDRGELSGAELREAMNVGASVLSYHLRKLFRLGLLESGTEGRGKRYRLREAEAVLRLLVRFRPTPDLVEEFLDLWRRVGVP